MTTYRVADGASWIEFDGTELASVSTETPDRVRWTELRLFRLPDDGEFRYLLHSTGRTLVFHRDGGCRKGSSAAPVPVGTLGSDMVACEDCWPISGAEDPSDLPDDVVVRAERDRPYVDLCENADALSTVMRDRYQRVVKRPVTERSAGLHLTGPSRQLLEDAGRVDPDIHALLNRVIRLTP